MKLGLVHCLQKAKILDILYVFYMPLSRNLLMKLTNISLTLVLATENVKKKKENITVFAWKTQIASLFWHSFI